MYCLYLPGQCLLQLGVREGSEPACGDGVVEELDVRVVGLSVERRAAQALGLQQHLVFLVVGVLEYHLCAVRQRQFLVAQQRVGLLAGYAPLGGQLLDEGLVLHVVHVGRELLGLHGGHGLLDALLGGVSRAVLLAVEADHDHVAA